ncbi:MAG: methyltransferase domain-containing protein [Bacteroidota bacterium]
MNLSSRNTEPELMDDPNVDIHDLRETLKDINLSNKMLGGNRITVKEVGKFMNEYPKALYTIMDMGCGDGSMLREIAHFCRKNGQKVRLVGIDLSEKAIQIGKDTSSAYPEIHFQQQDILQLSSTDFNCDILLCTLTMHHFNDNQIPIFLKQFVKLAGVGIIINDLERSKWACYLFKLFRAIFIKSKIAKYDGLISIKSGFKKRELMHFAQTLPKVQHMIQWKWAFRYVWVIKTNRLTPHV